MIFVNILCRNKWQFMHSINFGENIISNFIIYNYDAKTFTRDAHVLNTQFKRDIEYVSQLFLYAEWKQRKFFERHVNSHSDAAKIFNIDSLLMESSSHAENSYPRRDPVIRLLDGIDRSETRTKRIRVAPRKKERWNTEWENRERDAATAATAPWHKSG